MMVMMSISSTLSLSGKGLAVSRRRKDMLEQAGCHAELIVVLRFATSLV